MDRVTFRIILGVLGVVLLVLVAGSILLMLRDKAVPDWYQTTIVSLITGTLGLAVKGPESTPLMANAPAPAAVLGGDVG